MLLYAERISARLQYIADFIGKEISREAFQITTNIEYFRHYQGTKINYSNEGISEAEFFLMPHLLLFEKNIQPQAITCFETNNNKVFFKTNGDYPFDIFAASFYLLSRYEEYLPHKKDMYGRYAHENSLAFKKNFLHLPLINIWLQDFKKSITAKFPELTTHNSRLTFLSTYDIDIAWSYKHKGWRRNFGGILRSLSKGDWAEVKERINVLKGKQKDPFDAYDWMNKLHEQYNIKPHYFFLVPEKRGKYDKNISPVSKAMQRLIKDHTSSYPVGIHPSWRSGDDISLLKKEIETLSNITGNQVSSSRQHYIRFTLPETFRRLIDNGIRSDFSMGYGSINGFRASVASPFYWYDLEKEEQTQLLLIPFCYMEANSFYEQKYSAQQALEEMRQYYNVVKSVTGYFIMIWHNSFLGTDKLSAGWKEIYEQFIKEVMMDNQ